MDPSSRMGQVSITGTMPSVAGSFSPTTDSEKSWISRASDWNNAKRFLWIVYLRKNFVLWDECKVISYMKVLLSLKTIIVWCFMASMQFVCLETIILRR